MHVALGYLARVQCITLKATSRQIPGEHGVRGFDLDGLENPLGLLPRWSLANLLPPSSEVWRFPIGIDQPLTLFDLVLMSESCSTHLEKAMTVGNMEKVHQSELIPCNILLSG